MRIAFYVTGLNCSGCVANAQALLAAIPGATSAHISLYTGKTLIESSRPIPRSEIDEVLATTPRYRAVLTPWPQLAYLGKRKLRKFAPLLVMFGIVALIAVAVMRITGAHGFSEGMRVVMASYFIAFGALKVANVRAFARSYGIYDPIASRIPAYGYAYPFIEWALATAYFSSWHLALANGVTALLMSQKAYSVYKTLQKKESMPQCACLGGFFTIPISYVTLFEDSVMAAMAFASLSL